MQSHADVIAALENAGLELPRQGKNYVTARIQTTASGGG